MKKENKTLDHTHPELCKEWDYEKNYPLTPKKFIGYAKNLLKINGKCLRV